MAVRAPIRRLCCLIRNLQTLPENGTPALQGQPPRRLCTNFLILLSPATKHSMPHTTAIRYDSHAMLYENLQDSGGLPDQYDRHSHPAALQIGQVLEQASHAVNKVPMR